MVRFWAASLVTLLLTSTGCLPVAVIPAPEDYANQNMTVFTGRAGSERVHADGYVVLARFSHSSIPEVAHASLLKVRDGEFRLPSHWRIRVWSLHWFVWGRPKTWWLPGLCEDFQPVVLSKTFIAGHHRAGADCLPHDEPLKFTVGKNADDPKRAREYWQESFRGIRSEEDPGPREPRTFLLSAAEYVELKQWVDEVMPPVPPCLEDE